MVFILFTINSLFNLNNNYFLSLDRFLPFSLNILFTSLGILIYVLTGQYKSLTRYVGSKDIYKIASRNAVLVLIIFSVMWNNSNIFKSFDL